MMRFALLLFFCLASFAAWRASRAMPDVMPVPRGAAVGAFDPQATTDRDVAVLPPRT